METHRRQEATRKSRRRKEDSEKFKEEQNKHKAKERSDANNTYLNEVRLAAIFPCVCCHTLNFRQQVVEFSQKQEDSIKEKALAVYQKQKVQITIFQTDIITYLLYRKSFVIFSISHEKIS